MFKGKIKLHLSPTTRKNKNIYNEIKFYFRHTKHNQITNPYTLSKIYIFLMALILNGSKSFSQN